jgi:hypothetical protein
MATDSIPTKTSLDREGKTIQVITPEQYFHERVEEKIRAYTRLSRIYRAAYLVIGTVSIVASSLVPVLINTTDTLLVSYPRVLPTLLSLVVTILVAVEKLFRFREYWRNFDTAEESLKREKFMYQARTGEYDNKSDDDAFATFVKRFEEKIKLERMQSLGDPTRDYLSR